MAPMIVPAFTKVGLTPIDQARNDVNSTSRWPSPFCWTWRWWWWLHHRYPKYPYTCLYADTSPNRQAPKKSLEVSCGLLGPWGVLSLVLLLLNTNYLIIAQKSSNGTKDLVLMIPSQINCREIDKCKRRRLIWAFVPLILWQKTKTQKNLDGLARTVQKQREWEYVRERDEIR